MAVKVVLKLKGFPISRRQCSFVHLTVKMDKPCPCKFELSIRCWKFRFEVSVSVFNFKRNYKVSFESQNSTVELSASLIMSGHKKVI